MADRYYQKRRRFPAGWVLPPLILAAYGVLFPVPGGRESYLRPVWALELTQAAIAPQAQTTGAFPFRVEELFGYATPQGQLVHLERVLYGVALSRAGFINYGQVPDHFVFMSPRGRMQYGLASSGYPVLADDGQALYAVASDLSTIRRLDDDGKTLWSLGFPSQITGLSLSGEECVLGLLEGRLLSIGAQGEVLYEHAPSGSRIPVVLAVAVGPKGSPIAAVAGEDPQRLLLIERQGAVHTPRLALELGTDFRREPLLRFSEDGRFLYVEGSDELTILDVRRHRLSAVAVPGRLQAFAGGGLATALAVRAGEDSRLIVLRPLQAVLSDQPLGPGRPFLRIQGETLIIGLRGYLLRADLVGG